MGFFKELAQNAIEGYVKSQLSPEQRAMLDKLQGPVKTKSGYSVQYIQDHYCPLKKKYCSLIY